MIVQFFPSWRTAIGSLKSRAPTPISLRLRMSPLRVGFDTSPLYGPKTGIGFAVEAMHRALGQRTDVELRRLPAVGSGAARQRRPATAAARRARAPVLGPLGPPQCRPLAGRHRRGARHQLRRAAQPAPAAGVGVRLLVPAPPRRCAARRFGSPAGCCAGPSTAAPSCTPARTPPPQRVRELLPGRAGPHRAPRRAPTCRRPRPMSPIPQLDGSAVHRRHRHARTAQEPAAAGRCLRPDRGASTPTLQLVLAGGDGDDRDAINTAVDALGPALPTGCCSPGASTTPCGRGCCTTHAVLAYPSLDEGFGFPLLDAMQAGVPDRGQQRRFHPRGGRRRSAAVRRRPTSWRWPATSTRPSPHRRSARTWSPRAASSWRQFSWERCGAEMADLYRQVAAGDSRHQARSRR